MGIPTASLVPTKAETELTVSNCLLVSGEMQLILK